MGQNQIAFFPGDFGVVLRRARKVGFRPGKIVFRMGLDPRMVQGRMIGHEVKHQPETALIEPFTQAGQRLVAAQVRMRRVGGDRKSRAGDILLAQIRQGRLKIFPPLGLGARHLLPASPVVQTLRNQIQVKPRSARRSNSASGISSRVAGRPSILDNSVSQTRVLI